MDDTGSSGHRPSAKERARLRDAHARERLGLSQRHGDVGPSGDLVDELSPARRLQASGSTPPDRGAASARGPSASDERAARLAAAICAADYRMAQMHLACLLKALERVPS